MNVCSNPELQDLLLLYLEGELSGEKRDEMAAHLAVCEFCEKEADELREGLKIAALTLYPTIESMFQLSHETSHESELLPFRKNEKVPGWFKVELRQNFKKERRFFPLIPAFSMAICLVFGFLFFLSGLLYNQNQFNAPPKIRIITKIEKIEPSPSQTRLNASEKKPEKRKNLSRNKSQAATWSQAKFPIFLEKAEIEKKNESTTQYTFMQKTPRPAYSSSRQRQYVARHYTLLKPKSFSFTGFYLMLASIPFLCAAGLLIYRFFRQKRG